MMLHKCASTAILKNAISVSNRTRPCSANVIFGDKVSGGKASVHKRFKVTLPDLPYDYGALEPVISAEIMELHYSKHHQTVVDEFNIAEEKLADAIEKGHTSAIIGLQGALRFNGGGSINHSLLWQHLCPEKDSGQPEGALLEAINRDFGSIQSMQETLSSATVAIQGSGWGWLGYNKEEKRLEIATCPNQDPLEATTGLIPLFGIDVWEHAYYLQYKNVRPDYVKSIYRVANWKEISARLDAALV